MKYMSNSVLKDRFYVCLGMVRPPDQEMMATEKIFIYCSQEEGAWHSRRDHIGKHQS